MILRTFLITAVVSLGLASQARSDSSASSYAESSAEQHGSSYASSEASSMASSEAGNGSYAQSGGYSYAQNNASSSSGYSGWYFTTWYIQPRTGYCYVLNTLSNQYEIANPNNPTDCSTGSYYGGSNGGYVQNY